MNIRFVLAHNFCGKNSVFDCLCFLVSVLHVCLATATSTGTHLAANVGSVCDKTVGVRDTIKGTRSFPGDFEFTGHDVNETRGTFRNLLKIRGCAKQAGTVVQQQTVVR